LQIFLLKRKSWQGINEYSLQGSGRCASSGEKGKMRAASHQKVAGRPMRIPGRGHVFPQAFFSFFINLLVLSYKVFLMSSGGMEQLSN
jgi:hypothetical protein